MRNTLKAMLKISAALAILMLVGCAETISPYEHASNWLIRQNDIPQYFADFDVFFLPPAPADRPDTDFARLLPGEQDKILYNDARCLTVNPFGNRCRIFIPRMDSLSLRQYQELSRQPRKKKEKLTDLQPLRQTIDRAAWALDFYLTHLRTPGHPFIIMADGISAEVLYHAMRESEFLAEDSGFTAAYLPGMPGRTVEEIRKDFKGSGIRPAQNADDFRVIVTWTGTAAAPASDMFCRRGIYQINPLGWQTGPEKAVAAPESRALFYDRNARRLQNRIKEIKAPCSARLIPEQGRLQLNLVPALRDNPLMRPRDGIYHDWNLNLFIGDIVNNARKRTANMKTARNWTVTD